MACSSDTQMSKTQSYSSSTWSEITNQLSMSEAASLSSKSPCCPSVGSNATGASLTTLSYQPFELCVEQCSDEIKECATDSQSICDLESNETKRETGSLLNLEHPLGDSTRSLDGRAESSVVGTSYSSGDNAYAETWLESGSPIENPPETRVAWPAVAESTSTEESSCECRVEYFPSWMHDAEEELPSPQSAPGCASKRRRYAWPGDEPSTDCPVSSPPFISITCPDELVVEDLSDNSIPSGELYSLISRNTRKRTGVPTYSLHSDGPSTQACSSVDSSGNEFPFLKMLNLSLKQDNSTTFFENMAVPFVLEANDNLDSAVSVPWPCRNNLLSQRWRDVAEILPSVKGMNAKKRARRLRYPDIRTKAKHSSVKTDSEKLNISAKEIGTRTKDTSRSSSAKYSKHIDIRNNDAYKCRDLEKGTETKNISESIRKSSAQTSPMNPRPTKRKEFNNMKSSNEKNKNQGSEHDDEYIIRSNKINCLNQCRISPHEILEISPDNTEMGKNNDASYAWSENQYLKITSEESVGVKNSDIHCADQQIFHVSTSALPSQPKREKVDQSGTLDSPNPDFNSIATVSKVLNLSRSSKFCEVSSLDILSQRNETDGGRKHNLVCDLEISPKYSSTSSTKDSVLDSQKSCSQSEHLQNVQNILVENNSQAHSVLQKSVLDSLSQNCILNIPNLYVSLKNDPSNMCNVIERGTEFNHGKPNWVSIHHELSSNGIQVKSEVVHDTERTVDNNIPRKIEFEPSTFCNNSDSGLTLDGSGNESGDHFSNGVTDGFENQSSRRIAVNIPEKKSEGGEDMFKMKQFKLDDPTLVLDKCKVALFDRLSRQEWVTSKCIQESFDEVIDLTDLNRRLVSRKRTRSTTILYFNSYQPSKKLKRPTSWSVDSERVILLSNTETHPLQNNTRAQREREKNCFEKEPRTFQNNTEKSSRNVGSQPTSTSDSKWDFGVVNYQMLNAQSDSKEPFNSGNFIISEFINQSNELKKEDKVTGFVGRLEIVGNRSHEELGIVKPTVPLTTQQNKTFLNTTIKQCTPATSVLSAKENNGESETLSSTTCVTNSENDSREGGHCKQQSSWLHDAKRFSNSISNGNAPLRLESNRTQDGDRHISESNSWNWKSTNCLPKEDVGGSSESRSEEFKPTAWFVRKEDGSSESRSDEFKRRTNRRFQKETVRKRVLRHKRKPPKERLAFTDDRLAEPRFSSDSPRCRRSLLPFLTHPPPSPRCQHPRRFATFGHQSGGGPATPIFRKPGTSSESMSPVRDSAFDGFRKISRQVSRSFLGRNDFFGKEVAEKYCRNYKQYQDKTNLYQERCKSGKTRGSKTSSKSGDSYETGRSSRYFLKRSAMRFSSLLSNDPLLFSKNTYTDCHPPLSDSKDLPMEGKSKSGDVLRNSHGKRKRSQNLSKSFSEFQTLKKQLALRNRTIGAPVLQPGFPALPGTCFVPVPILQPRHSWVRRSRNVTFQRSHPILSPLAPSPKHDSATAYTLVQGVCAPNEGPQLAHSVLPLDSVLPLTLGSVALPQLVVPVNWQHEMSPSTFARPTRDNPSQLKAEWLESSQVVPSVSPALVHVLCVQPVTGKRHEK